MASFRIFAFLAVAGCAKLQASVGAPVTNAHHVISKTLETSQPHKRKIHHFGPSYGVSLWFLPWSSSESSLDQISLDERVSLVERSVTENSYWLNPPKFFRDLLRLKRALVEDAMERLNSSHCQTVQDGRKTALFAMFNAYAQMETPLLEMGEMDRLGADASLQKVITASDGFWKWAANTRLKPSPGQDIGFPVMHRKGLAAYFSRVRRDFCHKRKLEKLLKDLKEAEECMVGIYYSSSALSFLSSSLLECLKRHRITLTPSSR